MKITKLILFLVVLSVLAWGAVAPPALHAQVTKQALETVGEHLQAAQSFYSKLSPQQRKMLSGGSSNFFKVVEEWPDFQRRALTLQKSLGAGQLRALRRRQSSQPAIPTTAGPVPVSNPETDFLFGPAGAFTQSETSTALCGRHVVVGFNDSGSVLESLFATKGNNLSFNGFGVSGNRGLNFTDEGFLDSTGAGGNPFNFLLGDPVLACARSSHDDEEGPPTFFYSSILITVSTAAGPLSAVSVSKSTDGEDEQVRFGSPLIAVAKDANTHFLDKDWMAVNPMNPKQIAVTYTDFDISATNGCMGLERIAIETVASNDAGASWSPPTVIAQLCSNGVNFVQGSQVAFSPTGAVYVAFESFPNGNGTLGGREILFTSAPNIGAGFGPLARVASVTGIGDGFEIQGGFRSFIDIQGMSVDRSRAATRGNIYIVWHDTSADSLFDFSGIGYGYSDSFIAKSTDRGVTWSAPAQVDRNPEPMANGLGTDSYMPGVAVDPTSGEVGVCWYDRRNDPLNYQVQRFCGVSFDAGATFTNTPMNPTPFPPIHGTDDQVNPFYFGDYDTVSSDGFLSAPGFIGAFQIVSAQGGKVLVPNPDVFARNFN